MPRTMATLLSLPVNIGKTYLLSFSSMALSSSSSSIAWLLATIIISISLSLASLASSILSRFEFTIQLSDLAWKESHAENDSNSFYSLP